MCPARQFNYTNLGDYSTHSTMNFTIDIISCRLVGRQKWLSRLVVVDFNFATDNVTFSMRKNVIALSLCSCHLQLCAQ
jgi:hypothetical protein